MENSVKELFSVTNQQYWYVGIWIGLRVQYFIIVAQHKYKYIGHKIFFYTGNTTDIIFESKLSL